MTSRTIASALFSLLIAAVPARAIEWAKVPGKDVVLFYPAQLSWEILLSQAQHTGANRFKKDRSCRQCHEGGEVSSGDLLVAEKTLEPTPIAGKPGSLKATIKFARDDERLYVHVEFIPGTQPNAGMDPKFDSRVALMFDDQSVFEMTRGGCYAACHIDSATMPRGGQSDMTMYLPGSRHMITRTGGDFIKPAEDLAALRARGAYAEYWQAGLNPGVAPVAASGFVLEKREEQKTSAVSAAATFDRGKWAVTFSRKLSAGAPYKDLSPGKIYTVGFSIHAGHTNRRFHYVSLEKTFTLDEGEGDFVAVRVP